jgi:hypothetical protein
MFIGPLFDIFDCDLQIQTPKFIINELIFILILKHRMQMHMFLYVLNILFCKDDAFVLQNICPPIVWPFKNKLKSFQFLFIY